MFSCDIAYSRTPRLRGLVVREKGLVTDGVAVAQRPYPPPSFSHVHAAALATRSHLAQGNGMLALALDEPLDP
jgi:hypothetical protein